MKKQLAYAGLMTRVLATTIDMFLVSCVITPIMQLVNKWYFFLVFREYVVRYGVNLNDTNAIAIAFRSPDMAEYLTFAQFMSYVLLMLCTQIVLVGTYFVVFWYYKSWTPGKYILRLRVRDSESLEKVTLWQAIKRFICCSIALVGIWFIVFSKKRQALHDKLAKTVVIKA